MLACLCSSAALCEGQPRCRYGYQPHRIAFWIYSHAIRLLFKGVTLHDRPGEAFQRDVQSKAGEVPCMPCGARFRWRPPTQAVWQ